MPHWPSLRWLPQHWPAPSVAPPDYRWCAAGAGSNLSEDSTQRLPCSTETGWMIPAFVVGAACARRFACRTFCSIAAGAPLHPPLVQGGLTGGGGGPPPPPPPPPTR